MKGSRKFFFYLLASALALAFTGMAGGPAPEALAASDVVKWKCQLYWPVSSPSYPHAGNVVGKLKARSQGRLLVETFPAEALVPTSEIFNAVKRGMVEFASISPSYCLDQVPLGSLAAGLPLNFPEVWEGLYFFKHMGFEEMMREAFAKHGLYYVTEKVLTTQLSSKNPIRSSEDFKGLKIRSIGMLLKYFKSIGAAASYLPASEIYSALASGVIEGVNYAGAQSVVSMKFYEVCKYYLKMPLGVEASSWIANQKAIDKLPKDLQMIFYSTMEDEMWRRTNEYEYLENLAIIDLQKKHGLELVDFTQAEYGKLQKLAVPIWDEVAKKGPDCAKAVDMLKKFNKTLGRQ